MGEMPDPQTPCFFFAKAREARRRKQGFSPCGTPNLAKSFEKKTARRNARKIGKGKKQGNPPAPKKARVGGSGCSLGEGNAPDVEPSRLVLWGSPHAEGKPITHICCVLVSTFLFLRAPVLI